MATATQEQIVRLAPFQEQFLADIFKSAENLTQEGSSMPFSAQQLAGLSQGQRDAISRATAGVGSFEPFLQRGAEAIGQGIGQLGTAQQRVAAAGFSPTDFRQFMDPFTEDVIAATQADIARQGAMQQNQLGAGAVGAGAFGGSRQAVAQSEIARNVMDQQARTGAQLRSQGFQQAQNLAQQAAQQQLRQAQLTGQLGQTVAGLGTQTAALGQLGQQMGVQDVNTLLGIGGLQQQQGQKELDVARANELAQQALPFQRIGFLSNVYAQGPKTQSQIEMATAPTTNPLAQSVGAGLGAFQAFSGIQGA